MVLGMTHGELGLVLFIFGLVYSAGLLPRLSRWLTAVLGGDQG